LKPQEHGIPWQNYYPADIREITKLLSGYYGAQVQAKDNKMKVMISECGYGNTEEAFMPTVKERTTDPDRTAFFDGITASLQDAILIDKTPITSFIAWSLLDNLEWLTFEQVWGMVSVDQIGGTLDRSERIVQKHLLLISKTRNLCILLLKLLVVVFPL
jgi:beta-glucosidase/6-phospho-beta-glucosidase/beta-galactosidase